MTSAAKVYTSAINPALGLVLTFMGMGGGEKQGASKPSSPMSYEGNFEITGNITENYGFNPVRFMVPGSDNASTENTIPRPVYNEVLGVFSLLETPKLKYVTYV